MAQLEAGSLAPEPAVLTGARVGFARVSTAGQLLDRQTRALTDAGCLRVFAETGSGRSADRPELAACGVTCDGVGTTGPRPSSA